MTIFSSPNLIAFKKLTPSCSLPRNQVPEWASAYINYKGLKKLIKAAAATAKSGEKVDLAGRDSPPEPCRGRAQILTKRNRILLCPGS